MVGPWFTVHESGGDWKVIDRIGVSDGLTDERAIVEVRLRLAPPAIVH